MINVKNLNKSFKENILAVNNVSFELSKGEIGCIIGTSGCGKVLIDGRDAQKAFPVAWRRKIGYVIQKAGLLPHLTVFENISLLSKIMGKSP